VVVNDRLVVPEGQRRAMLRRARNADAHVVQREWVCDSIKRAKLQDEAKYVPLFAAAPPPVRLPPPVDEEPPAAAGGAAARCAWELEREGTPPREDSQPVGEAPRLGEAEKILVEWSSDVDDRPVWHVVEQAAVVLFLVSVLGAQAGGGSLLTGLAQAMVQAAGAIAAIVAAMLRNASRAAMVVIRPLIATDRKISRRVASTISTRATGVPARCTVRGGPAVATVSRSAATCGATRDISATVSLKWITRNAVLPSDDSSKPATEGCVTAR
jgi:hypothetical protein